MPVLQGIQNTEIRWNTLLYGIGSCFCWCVIWCCMLYNIMYQNSKRLAEVEQTIQNHLKGLRRKLAQVSRNGQNYCMSESCERECSETSMALFWWGFHLHVCILHLYFLSLCMCKSHCSECTTLLRIVCIVHRTVTFILVTYKCLRLAVMACAERYGSSYVINWQVISLPLPNTNFQCW